VIANPRYRPSDLVFPPEITGAFAEVQRTTKALSVESSPDTTIQTHEDRFLVRLFASSPHHVAVSLLREDGTTIRTLYAGPIGDSLEVYWDGLDSTGAPVNGGTLLLSATSQTPDGHPIRTTRVPLDIAVLVPPEVPTPPPLAESLFLPERVKSAGSLGPLAAGLADGILVAVLPAVVAAGTHPSDGRFVIAAGIGAAGLAAFVTHRGTHAVPANVAANQRLRDEWQHRVDAAARQNARRRREPGLVIHARPRVVIEQGRF